MNTITLIVSLDNKTSSESRQILFQKVVGLCQTCSKKPLTHYTHDSSNIMILFDIQEGNKSFFIEHLTDILVVEMETAKIYEGELLVTILPSSEDYEES